MMQDEREYDKEDAEANRDGERKDTRDASEKEENKDGDGSSRCSDEEMGNVGEEESSEESLFSPARPVATSMRHSPALVRLKKRFVGALDNLHNPGSFAVEGTADFVPPDLWVESLSEPLRGPCSVSSP
jgi:hypothetical protein